MESAKTLQAEYLLRKLIVSNGEKFASSHPWLWENERLKELIFATFTQVVSLNHEKLRHITNQLYSMGLLDIKKLSALGTGTEMELEENMLYDHITEILVENGFTDDEAKDAITTICEIATGLEKNHGGKIQKFLRAYGEILLNDVSKNFSFSVLDKKQIRTAFVYWLQNVANVPIQLDDDILDEFAQRHGLDKEILIQTADNMELNLAFLDDLIYSQVAQEVPLEY